MTWKNERDCGVLELYWRKAVTSLLYFRGYRLLHRDEPFYAPGAVRHIERFLTSEMVVFEWGSGASSLWYARRADQYIGVEHDAQWHQSTAADFRTNGLDQATVLFVPPKPPDPSFDWSRDWPGFQLLGRPPGRPEFRDYIAAIDSYPDQSFDLISVDGRERIGCLVHATPKLRPGGILILDDAHRPSYQQASSILSRWQVLRYDFGLQQTAVFIKPA